jgi:hypothetical protein
MKAEDFIGLIEQNRFDKISKNGMTLIAERFRELQSKQLTSTDVGNCPFEAYAVFCIECDRKGLKPIKYKDYLKLG